MGRSAWPPPSRASRRSTSASSARPSGRASSEFHKARIFGQHVAEYMNQLKEEDTQEFDKMFSGYTKAGVDADDIESMYQKAHAAIRKDPVNKKKERKVENKRTGNKVTCNGKT